MNYLSPLFCLTKPFLHALDPETAHGLTLKILQKGLYPRQEQDTYPQLHQNLWGLDFYNPVGLAAGFDKNAEVIAPILKMGFGFAEAGTVTPQPQEGNPRPRIFREAKNQAVINRMGFPNKGLPYFQARIQSFREDENRPDGIVGLNIGMNKTQTEPADDYCLLVKELWPYADYFTINISSPNTPGLRNLQSRNNLLPLIDNVKLTLKIACGSQNAAPPIMVKLAPDLTLEQKEELAQAALDSGVDGLILTNTTLDRPDFLPEDFRTQTGGLSGKPLTEKSTATIADFYRLTKGKIPIIGVGGISSAQDAYDKIKAGASLIQIYSALVFQGPALVSDINKGLATLLTKDGYPSVSQAIGQGNL